MFQLEFEKVSKTNVKLELRNAITAWKKYPIRVWKKYSTRDWKIKVQLGIGK